jgi:hypothetical protein
MTAPTYISLSEAKRQLRIDDSLTIHDDEINMLIGSAIDWAENYTNRSLGELLEVNSPADSAAVPIPDPKQPIGDCPGAGWEWDGDGGLWVDTAGWRGPDFLSFWARNPPRGQQIDNALPLRRDAKAGILLYLQTLFDRNIADLPLLEKRAEQLLWPYRRAMGVG